MSLKEETRKKALAILDRRDMSVKEFKDKFTAKGESEDTAAEAAQWLMDLHVLDDERYSGLVVRHYAAKGYGKRRIRDELYRRGVPKELWDGALAQLPAPEDAIRKFLRAKLRGRDMTADESRRLAAALQRRGFSWNDIRPVLNEWGQEIDE